MNIRIATAVALAAALGTHAAEKYATTCGENEKAGIPIILCQPMDQLVYPKEDAVFKVAAKGDNLSYKWFFENTNGVLEVPEALGPEVVIRGNNSDRLGFYVCRVYSAGEQGVVQTQTRVATLTERLPSIQTLSAISGPIWTNPPPPPPPPSTFCCTPICGYINYNNGGAGFSLASGQAMTIQLSPNSSGTPLINTALYCAQWRYGGQANQAGCFTNLSSTQERFVAPVTKPYAITVYIKSGCAPQGTLYYLFYQ
jgi:hypothetical protein